MGFLRKLFGEKGSPNPADISNEVQGKDAGTQIEKLILAAQQENWSPIPSITLHCINCDAPVSLHEGLSTPYDFVQSGAKGTVLKPMNQPLVCMRCGTESFRLTVQPTPFKAWLQDSLQNVRASDQDPALGFRDDETGELVRDRTLVRAGTFDDLWRAISRSVNPLGGFNPNFTFNMIGMHYLDREVPGLAHFNQKTNVLTTILKDESGNYWYSVERR
jgi:hypothetical protein